jgi:hypothetical protein
MESMPQVAVIFLYALNSVASTLFINTEFENLIFGLIIGEQYFYLSWVLLKRDWILTNRVKGGN